MSIKVLPLALVVAYGVCLPGALADEREQKAEPCMRCHVVDNAHGGPLLDGLPAGYLLKQFELYKSGKRFGPIMQSQMNALSAQELQDIAAWFAARRPTYAITNAPVDKQEAQSGLALANDLKCGTCHGQDYRGVQEVPRLAGQRRNYLALAIGRLQRDSTLHPPLATSGAPLPQASIEALASYLASLEP